MVVNYKIPGGIQYGSAVKYDNQLKTSRSLVLILQDILYGEKDLPEGAVPHLLGVTKEHRGPLCDLLHKYHAVFPGQLLK